MNRSLVSVISTACVFIFLVSIAHATPPPWAPAHGYRAKHGNVNEYDYRPDQDLGISSGRCNAEKVAAILGGVVGAVVGSEIGDGDGRKAAVVIGTILGVIIGKQIGRAIDEKDRYCTGQALEHANNGQPVKWVNPDTHYSYQVTPLNHYLRGERPCREFETIVTTASGQTSKQSRDACRDTEGVWRTIY